MIWASWQDFFFMGGYALYVWGSVLVCLLCLIIELVGLRLGWQRLRQSVARRWKLERAAPSASSTPSASSAASARLGEGA